jgi:hypothetical protein
MDSCRSEHEIESVPLLAELERVCRLALTKNMALLAGLDRFPSPKIRARRRVVCRFHR